MPDYEFECEKHGVFIKHKPLKDYKKPAKCPKCNKSSKRVIATSFPISQTWRP